MASTPPALIDELPIEGDLLDGKYEIERTLGIGGMAVVLKARHLRLEESVAIKMLLPQWASDPQIVERFAREGRAAIRIRSEHVVRVLDVGNAEGRPYLVMEYLDGQDLAELVSDSGPMRVQTAVDFLLQACEALAEAHTSGIVHRDLKPANLFLTHRADGTPLVKVLDFGISKVAPDANAIGGESHPTLPSTVMGSPRYMSPEQMQSSTDVDARSDIWSLGAILHELIAGNPPFVADSVPALYAQVLRDPAPPLSRLRCDVPPELEAAVMRCLEKDPDDRYANVAELARDIAKFGTLAAHSSAETITRVIEGTGGPRAIPRTTPYAVVSRLSQTQLALAKKILTRASRVSRRVPTTGYLAAVIALVAVGIGVSSLAADRVRAVREASASLAAAATPSSATTLTITTPAPRAAPVAGHARVSAHVAPPASAAPSATARPHTTHRVATSSPAAAPLPEPPIPADSATPAAALNAVKPID